MRIANTAALILAMVPFLASAQRSGGHSERKPSPATSAASTSSAPSGTQAAPSLQPPINPYRANSEVLHQRPLSQLLPGLLLRHRQHDLYRLSRHGSSASSRANFHRSISSGLYPSQL